MIACTPDGTVAYLSNGYGGRATDSAIVEDCSFLEQLIPGMENGEPTVYTETDEV